MALENRVLQVDRAEPAAGATAELRPCHWDSKNWHDRESSAVPSCKMPMESDALVFSGTCANMSSSFSLLLLHVLSMSLCAEYAAVWIPGGPHEQRMYACLLRGRFAFLGLVRSSSVRGVTCTDVNSFSQAMSTAASRRRCDWGELQTSLTQQRLDYCAAWCIHVKLFTAVLWWKQPSSGSLTLKCLVFTGQRSGR